MRIYHDSDRCKTDLWSPVDDPNGCAIENRAFSPYAKHTQELEDTINAIVDKIHEGIIFGDTSLSFNFDDDMSDEDIAYIEQEVQKRI